VSGSLRVTAIVLSWNGRERTLACLQSLEHVTYRPFSVVVVDNGSSDGSADAVAAKHPTVRLVRLQENRGFAGGMNAGARAAFADGAEAVLLLNNDMEVEPDCIEPLVAALVVDPSAGAACAQILFADAPPRIWYAGAPFRRHRGHHGRLVGYGRPPLPVTVTPYETDRACGGAMMWTAGTFDRVGPFDEELFAYAEDTDWSLRARRAGLRILVVPGSIVHHAVSASSGGESSPMTLYYDLRNSLVVAERWAPLGAVGTWLRRLEALAAHAAQALRSHRRSEGLRAVRDGWRDFRRGRLGQREGESPPAPRLLRRDPGLWLLLHLRPPGDRRGDRHGRCSVCGADTRFVRNSWVLPRELAKVAPAGFADRESQFCASCGSSLRVRLLADVLLEHYAGQARSIASLVEEERFRLLDIAELNSIGRMHPLLAPLPRLTYAEYPEQDIQDLTFADASFDLVLTSETLEHIPDFRRALTETRRVLRLGGRHVFTVPLDPRRERTRSRDAMAPMYHGRGGGPFALVTRRNDMLAYTDFGLDVPDLLREAGFEAEVHGSGVETVYCAIAR
jgi:GT2 family glycosyltransferase/SAM-dependent methyltransferase